MLKIIIATLAAISLATAATAHDLIAAGTSVTVARSTLMVTAGGDWNKLNNRPGRNAETWTLDGEQLNDLSFYAGIETGRPLLREVDRRNRPLPPFQSTMLPSDIPVLLESSYRIARDISIFTISHQEPVRFAGHDGIRFRYDFVGPDDIRRSGEAQGAIIDEKLYLITFEAPTIYFFDRSIDAFRTLAASARLQQPARRR
jgi:hypothetical protein